MKNKSKAMICKTVETIAIIAVLITMFTVKTYPGWMFGYPFTFALVGIAMVSVLGFYFYLSTNKKQLQMDVENSTE